MKFFEIILMIGVVDAIDGEILQVEITPVPYIDAESHTVTLPITFVPCEVHEGMTFYIEKDTSTGKTEVTCPCFSEHGC